MEKFEITKEQVLKVAEWGNLKDKELIKQWFPDAFKTKFTGWAKDIHEFNKKWIAYYENDVLKYGIDASGDWFKAKSNANYNECESNREATEQEVETALINEAKIRYRNDVNILSLAFNNDIDKLGLTFQYYLDRNDLWSNGIKIFNNGKWAGIIETITKEEAEKLLNKKII